MRVVIDTNCWFGILPADAPYSFLLDKLIDNAFELVVSNDIVLEYREIIGGRLRKVNADDFINLLEILPNVESIAIPFKFHLITVDPDDNKFVDCAIASNAACIVSDDKHFKTLRKIPFPKVTVMSLDKFATLIQD